MKRKNDKEAVSQKSAAEFFSEHQQIAGFDNPGKSLFTTIREFVENSLDGKCESFSSVRVLLMMPGTHRTFSFAKASQLNYPTLTFLSE